MPGFQRSFKDNLLGSTSSDDCGAGEASVPVGGQHHGPHYGHHGGSGGSGGGGFTPPPPPPINAALNASCGSTFGSTADDMGGGTSGGAEIIRMSPTNTSGGENSAGTHWSMKSWQSRYEYEKRASGDNPRTTRTGRKSSADGNTGGGADAGSTQQPGEGGFRSFAPWLANKKKKEEAEGTGAAAPSDKLGTVQGVFMPCMSQILGVIFFLRLPTITAQAGSIGTTLIIFTSVLSTLVTSLSLSAIATNGTIRAGGPYYIISRTLGVEIGGSLGMLFYLGTTLGSSMYVLGAVEAFNTNLGDYGAAKVEAEEEAIDDWVAYNEIDDDDDMIDDAILLAEEYAEQREDHFIGTTEIMSLVLMFILAFMVSVGMKYVNMLSNFFLFIVMTSIASILFGTVLFAAGVWNGDLHPGQDRALWSNVWPHYSPDPQTNVTPTFWSLLALFYPSVTGILAGTNRSAKLQTPSRSIPKGTIGAIAVTTSLYVILVWLMGSVVAHRTLLENKMVVAFIAWPNSVVIKVGIITACIGAGLQCLCGAPQLLAAIAADGAIPFLKVADPGERSEPTVAIWITWCIASLATLAGNLDYITPIITMFFLLMYGGINLCCFLLGWVHAPGFRPTFRYFHKNVSLFGFFWCLGLALVISWLMAFAAIGLIGLGYYYIYKKQKKKKPPPRQGKKVDDLGDERAEEEERIIGEHWGAVGDSLRYKLTTMVLMQVTGTENFHAKNWRPQLLTVVETDDLGNPVNGQVLALAAQMQKGRGLNMVVSIKRGSLLKPGAFEASREVRSLLQKRMKAEGMENGFPIVSVTQAGFCEAVISAVTHTGLGPVSPNIVLLPWNGEHLRKNPEREAAFVDCIRALNNMKQAVILFKGGHKWPRHGKVMRNAVIDIYWIVEDGGLCLLLPYILSKHRVWRRNVRIRVFAVATDPRQDPNELDQSVTEHLRILRINAEVNVVDMTRTDISFDMTGTRASSHNSGDGASTVDTGVWRSMTIDEAFSPLGSPSLMTSPSGPMQEEYEDATKMEEFQMQTAKMFNTAIRLNSYSSNLVVTNMPLVQSMRNSSAFVRYIDAMSDHIDNMLLVQGSEFEVVTDAA